VVHVDDGAARAQLHHAVLCAVRDVDVAGVVGSYALRLHEKRRAPCGRCPAGQELGVAIGQQVKDADPAVAVEGADEQVAPGADPGDLGARQRGPVEEARLRCLGHPRTAHGEPVDGPQIVDLAGGVPAARPGEVEDTAVVDGNRGR
jgi:hypothetical protein